jgi:hypothetical protein
MRSGSFMFFMCFMLFLLLLFPSVPYEYSSQRHPHPCQKPVRLVSAPCNS